MSGLFVTRYDLTVSPNHLDLTNRSSSAAIARRGAFSSPSNLIAEDKAFATLLHDMMRWKAGRVAG